MGFDDNFLNRIFRPISIPRPERPTKEIVSAQVVQPAYDDTALRARLVASEAQIATLNSQVATLLSREVGARSIASGSVVVTPFKEIASDGTLLVGASIPASGDSIMELALFPDMSPKLSDADSYVQEANPAVNYDGGDLVVGNLTANNNKRVLFSVAADVYPIGYWDPPSVAFLRLAVRGTPAEIRLYCHRITGAWVEGDVTWGSQPTYDVIALATCFVTEDDVYAYFDLTQFFMALRSAYDTAAPLDFYGFLILTDEDANQGEIAFYSKDNAVTDSQKPQLLYWETPDTSKVAQVGTKETRLYAKAGADYWFLWRALDANNIPSPWSKPVEVTMDNQGDTPTAPTIEVADTHINFIKEFVISGRPVDFDHYEIELSNGSYVVDKIVQVNADHLTTETLSRSTVTTVDDFDAAWTGATLDIDEKIQGTGSNKLTQAVDPKIDSLDSGWSGTDWSHSAGGVEGSYLAFYKRYSGLPLGWTSWSTVAKTDAKDFSLQKDADKVYFFDKCFASIGQSGSVRWAASYPGPWLDAAEVRIEFKKDADNYFYVTLSRLTYAGYSWDYVFRNAAEGIAKSAFTQVGALSWAEIASMEIAIRVHLTNSTSGYVDVWYGIDCLYWDPKRLAAITAYKAVAKDYSAIPAADHFHIFHKFALPAAAASFKVRLETNSSSGKYYESSPIEQSYDNFPDAAIRKDAFAATGGPDWAAVTKLLIIQDIAYSNGYTAGNFEAHFDHARWVSGGNNVRVRAVTKSAVVGAWSDYVPFAVEPADSGTLKVFSPGDWLVDKDGVNSKILTESDWPAHVVCIWPGHLTDIPAGWHLCDGSTIDGYALPDYRGLFIRGAPAGSDAGATGGEDSVTLDANDLPQHTHAIGGNTGYAGTDHTHAVEVAQDAAAGADRYSVKSYSGGPSYNTSTMSQNHQHGLPANTGNNTTTGTAHENRPAYREVLFIIKL